MGYNWIPAVVQKGFNSVKDVTEVKKNSMKLRNGISLRLINYSHTPNLLMVEDA